MRSSDEVDLILKIFGLPTPVREGFGPRDEPIILAEAADSALLGLAEYLEIEVPEQMGVAPPTCWTNSGLRVFVSHLSVKKVLAKTLADELSIYGFDAFVAHEDISPTSEWVREIQAALRTCDVMIAIMSSGFRESPWCDQEVGAAVGRMVPIVSLYYESHPHGFAGLIQGIPVAGKNVHQVVPQIVTQILKHPSTSGSASAAMAHALRHSLSWNQSNKIAALFEHVVRLEASSAKLIQEALADNGEVSGSHAAKREIPDLLSRFGFPLVAKVPTEAAADRDEIPF